MNIFVEGNELRQAAVRTNQIIGSMKTIGQNVRSIHIGTDNIWQGEAARLNKSNFDRLNIMLREYLNIANDTRQALVEAVDHYNATEQNRSRQVQQLSAEGIFD